ncbi:alpha/beta fold hydrolase [Microbacterium arborescens]|uniref:alpha/beta fold hydrolase n=1 Tax=Microbacterium arborescens TaxID=33883 RepID=UPI0025A0BFE8|nr:alpha/beta fold hydrolase [Microbacterium arborescens]WJM15710.1 alpha/beta fold hydrolase [Microbacterium arborescens]
MPSPRHALVLGASGLIGRHLVATLAAAGATVTAGVRSAGSAARVEQWLTARGVTSGIRTAIVDSDSDQIVAAGTSALAGVTEIHNCAGSYRFGMSADEARRANVGIVEKVVDLGAEISALRRIVHISGYRVGGQNPSSVPWSDDHRTALYRELGAYEASKVESDAIFQARANDRGISWTIVNPSSVIGDSATGESDQLIGLATTIGQLWDGTSAALPGDEATFLPVVTVDFLAAFMAAAAVDPAASGQAYWVLDDDTPPLADLLTGVGRHLGARIPRLRVPTSVIKKIPRSISGVDPETLTFLSSDRYPTASAQELAKRHGIRMPDVRVSLERWADHLAAGRFGQAVSDERRFTVYDRTRTFELGASDSRRVIFPGLPLNADTWAEVARAIGARAVDLPGLGLSGGSGIDEWEQWLPAVMAGPDTHIVGHSMGAAAAVIAADRSRAGVASLTLVAPFFLQEARGAASLPKWLVRAYLKRVTPTRLSRQLTGSTVSAAKLVSSAADLRRRSAASVAEHLGRARSPKWRAELVEALARFEGPVRIITGSDDPLASAMIDRFGSSPNVELIEIAHAGHHPQLTHAEELVAQLMPVRV